MSSSGDAAFPGGGMPRPSADKAFATVQRVRAEIEMLKSLLTSESSDDKQKDATYRRLMSAEQELLHAEGKVDKVKEKLKTAAAAVLPRTQDAPHVGSWARVALKIIRADGRVAAAKMTGGYGSPLKRQRSALGTAPGSPLYFDDIDSLLKRVISSTKVKLVRTGPTEVTVMCEGAFLAGIWFQVSESSNVDGRNYFKLPEARGFKNKKVLEPSAVGVFAVDEKPKQFGSSKHEVFKLLTERGCAAIAHYWTHEQNGALAFQALVEWLSLHRTVFRDRSSVDNRRLSYDLSRGVYLPACIRPFRRQLQIDPQESPPSPSRSVSNLTAVGLRERPPRHPRTCLVRRIKSDQSRHPTGLPGGPPVRSRDPLQSRGVGMDVKRPRTVQNPQLRP